MKTSARPAGSGRRPLVRPRCEDERAGPEAQPAEITDLLLAWSHGEEEALAELMPHIYDSLRRIAAGYLRRERRPQTWQTVDLVHEAFLRLARQRRVQWRGRVHFFVIAAQVMRRILVDRARSLSFAKRGGGAARVPLEEADGPVSEPAIDLLALHEALGALAERSAEQARIVELRFFAGLTKEEIAEAMGISPSTVSRRWRLARAWLHRHLRRMEDDERGVR